jgi:hypothetical protein
MKLAEMKSALTGGAPARVGTVVCGQAPPYHRV